MLNPWKLIWEVHKSYYFRVIFALSGTEILPPLEAVFSQPPLEGFARQVFLLTDGEVNNGSAIAALVRRHAANTRVFTFGIGSGASTTLCRDTAAAGA